MKNVNMSSFESYLASQNGNCVVIVCFVLLLMRICFIRAHTITQLKTLKTAAVHLCLDVDTLNCAVSVTVISVEKV